MARRYIAIDIIGYDWNGPKYITPRHTLAEIEPAIRALREETAALRAEVGRPIHGEHFKYLWNGQAINAFVLLSHRHGL